MELMEVTQKNDDNTMIIPYHTSPLGGRAESCCGVGADHGADGGDAEER
jgi:hypothetical protein